MSAPPAFSGSAAAAAEPQSEVRLWTTSKERRRVEDSADLFAIVTACDHLEKAYIRDASATIFGSAAH